MLHKRKPLVINALHRLLWPWRSLFFRVEVTGFENIPKSGACLLVANHNIGAGFEILFMADAWDQHFHGARPAYGLTHRVGFRMPGLKQFLGALGSVPATHSAADAVLKAGHTLLIFPGGLKEATRPVWKHRECHFFGRRGWIDIASRNQAPIVPVSISGSHLSNPVLWQSDWLATLLVFPRLLGLKQFPITASQLLWTWLSYSAGHPWWAILWVGMAAQLMPLIPAKMRIHFHAPTPADLVERTIQSAL